MYFGSVKFFKHLILGTVALLIIVPCVFCVILAIDNGKKDEQIAALKSGTPAVTEVTPNDMMKLYRNSLKEKEAFIKLVYDYDTELCEQIMSEHADKPDETDSIPVNAITAAPVTHEPVISGEVPTSDDTDDDTDSDAVDTTDSTQTAAPLTEPTPDTSTPTAGYAYLDMLPDLYAEPLGNVVYDKDMDYVYLTFDDGPSKYTENILYYLDKYNIKATFFVVPDGSDQCAERLRKIADAGHTIGIHTASHVYNDIYSSVESYLDDFALAYDRVYEATGIKCRLFRFPGGSKNDYNGAVRDDIIAEMTRRGFIYFDWNVDSNDAMGATWTEMYNNVLTQTANCNRAVILMHDYEGGYNTVLVLEDIIKALISDTRNYKLSKLTETVKPVQF